MRKLVAVESITLDGVMAAPEQWSFPFQNDEIMAVNLAGMRSSDALLLGRITYEHFGAYWPKQTNDASGIADYLNKTAKFVVSTTLEQPDWVNTTVIRDNLATAVKDLKQQPGLNITVLGSATLVQSLIDLDLIDEWRLMVHPLLLGSGKPLFRAGGVPKTLRLSDSRVFSTGVALLTYQPADTRAG